MAKSNGKTEQWHRIYDTYLADTSSLASFTNLDQKRREILPEMTNLLASFIAGNTSIQDFNTIFQQETHNKWNVFGVRGLSGGMFLNKLTKYLSQEKQLIKHLRVVLQVPAEAAEAHEHMQMFYSFLQQLIAFQKVTLAQVQPARLPFFLSSWWHVQNVEQWPVFHLSARNVLLAENITKALPQSPVETYFIFRSYFISLANTLHISSWELEHFLIWYEQQQRQRQTESPHTPKNTFERMHIQSRKLSAETVLRSVQPIYCEDKKTILDEQGSVQVHLIWLLAKLGKKVGCQVWIAERNHTKVWKNEQLGMLSLSILPILSGSAFHKIIRQIDVVWLFDNKVIAAYEIEKTITNVTTSLLRLSDLSKLLPKTPIYLCVVAPYERFKKISFELSRPHFHEHGLQKRYWLLNQEYLFQQEEHMLRWAGSLSVLDDLLASAEEYIQT